MDSAASFEEDNSDSDYMNVSSSSESSEENEFPAKRSAKILPLKRKDGLENTKNTLSRLNIKQSTGQTSVKLSLKRKFSFTNTTTKKENDGTGLSTISFQVLSASQSPDEHSLTPTMELESLNNPSILMPAPTGQQADDPPYFPEKYSGKLCAFCNLGERSQLGQGEMLRLELTEEESKSASRLLKSSDSQNSSYDEESKNGNDDLSKIFKSASSTLLQQQLNRRQKGLNKCKNPVITSEYVDELEKIGHTETIDFNMIVENGFYYVHRACAMWSFDVDRDPINDTLSNVSMVLKQSLIRKCSYCNHYGASAVCKMNCQRAFHFPCIAASGSFQDFSNCSVFCFDHLSHVSINCDEEVYCRNCNTLGDVSNLMVCSKCGDHYHGTCKGLAQQPGVRAGWQCNKCRSCQICRIPDTSDGRTLACETCDKLYHPQCLRPIMATVPKYGWKCRCCRICSDCGARTPGAGASSRWHNHYTVCDSCYQQRNKGYSCPICRKAYRAAAYREMVKCCICQKFVHSTCDPEADLTAYERRKEVNPDYEYTCGICKVATQNDRMSMAIRRSNSGDDDSLSASQESLDDIDMMDSNDGKFVNREDYGLGLGKGKPFVASKIAKKKLGLSGASAQRPKGVGKLGFQKRARTFDLGRKRGPKSKMRGVFGVPGIGLQRPVADSSKSNDDEPGSENRLVLCSAKDRFVLTQDICVMCGAIGTDQEGCLIACAQCGQCYHPYCVSVKVTKEILQKGWRCLDCTVCEGCGDKNDEARLILCDDCDISYHIYCMEPPLNTVPQGTWKCKWCAICIKCGSNEPGNNCSWQNSYTECGPCASQSNCTVCSEIYSDGELIIQCTNCDRWLHCQCDSIKNEIEAEKCAEEGYSCLLCRPKDVLPPHLQVKKKPPPLSTQSSTATNKDESVDENEVNISLALDGSHFVDGVYLSEHGMQFIKTLQTEPKRAKRRPKATPEVDKDAGILAAIESVVAGSADNSMEDVKLELMDPNEEAQIYKDGMTWSNSEPAPEGFSLFTTETGQVILRKKRQRNLQKLGIGGFAVRNRAVRTTKNDEEPSNLTNDDSKKKKPNRRKQKNKLIETYPTYLQEAFFGKPLMDSNVKVKLELSSSDDETKSNVSDDKTIKLSLEELKMIEEMRAKQQQKLQEEEKILQLNTPNTQPVLQSPQLMSNGAQIQLNQKMQTPNEFNTQTSVTNADLPNQTTTPTTDVNQVPEIKSELDMMDDDENNSDTEALKDLGLPGDLLDNDLVNTIMNEDDDLTKNTAVLGDVDVKDVKDDLADILSPHFNIDMEDMLFKSVLTDESQESQESALTNSLTSYSTQSTPSHQSENQSIHLNQPTTPLQSTNMNPLQSPQPSNTNINPLMQPHSPQINTQLNPLNQHIMLQQQQQQVQQQQVLNPMQLQQPMMQRQNSQPAGPSGMPTVQRGYNFNEFGYRPQFNTSTPYPNQPQWTNQQIDNDFDLNAASMNASQTGQAPKNNHQKNSERMCEDEKLGDLSTISSVLYANQNHPELKIEYPHWPDRYKQIMKKWRALSADKKQPYLQRARDNRSAQQAQMRTKKAQQVAPDLSPDNGTTSTNSTSPALSSTLSESSSMMDSNMIQQSTTTNIGQQQIQVDQDKITAQQKSIKEAEQERQWKLLQAQRAREQQLGMPPEHQRMNDPNLQLQITTSLNDGSMSPVASPSPNSRNQFMVPPNKGRMMINPQSPSSSFQHPGRPVLQLQRQQSQQRMNQSPFSPQTSTPQSPNDLFPGSPSTDGFQRPQHDEQQQFLHSPQTPKPMAQQQSPVHTPGTPNSAPNMSPVYGQVNQNQQQQQVAGNISTINSYVQAPGTPRPNFNPGQTRTTVYARPDMFSKPPYIQPQASNHEHNNRQLRDLLQRTQAPTNIPGPTPSSMQPTFNVDNDVLKNQQQNQAIQMMQNNPNQPSDNTFRQPLPPGIRQQRMQSMVGGQMIRSTTLGGPQPQQQRMIMTPDSHRPRMGIRPPVMNINQQQMLNEQQQQQQQQQQMNQGPMAQQRMPLTPTNNFGNVQNEMIQQVQTGMIPTNNANNINQNMIMTQRIVVNQNMQHNIQPGQINQPHSAPPHSDVNVPTTVQQQASDAEGIPDSVTAELEKLEQDENAGMDGVGDILGGLGDDDDDLLDSLTAEMGADFNILEYGDPELDTTDEKSTLLDSLEMDEGEAAKEEKAKNLEAEKLAKANFQRSVEMSNVNVPQNPPLNRMTMQTQNQTIPNQMAPNAESQPLDSNPGTSQPQQQQQQQQQQQPQMNNQQMFQQANVQRQVRFKGQLPPNQMVEHIHQQMMLQLQQAAAQGKPMQIGTRLVANNPAGPITGTVTGPNTISLSFPSGIQRLPQVRMVSPNIQGNQNNPRMVLPHMLQNRPNMMQNAQQQVNPNMQNMMGNQQQQQVVPPPPYPEPPPPYPGQNAQNQEQPLLLEDLLEQEKREQARNIGSGQVVDVNNPQNVQQGLLNDQDYEKLRADVLTTTTQSVTMTQQMPQQQQQQQQQQQFAPRGIITKQWRPQTPGISNAQAPSTSPDLVRSVPIYNANLTPMPPTPPEIILTEADKQTQINFETWLATQNDSLQKQLAYYETEIAELRKLKKSLNTKQRQLKKNGADLNEIDAQTLMKVSQEQATVQKQLENARKQVRNHLNIKQDYDNKQKAKQMANNPHMVQSPGGQMNDQSPMMSPSPNIIQQPVQSPHGQIMAPSQSPLHSPSPMMNIQSAQSPGANSVMQSPSAHMNNAMSPYNTTQQSPRIGTPHSQIDESPFSPNSGPIESPSITSRLTSPVPRMTSPQHRPSTPMQIQMMNRQQVQFSQVQQNINQQNRFVRPQMIPNDGNNRMRMPTFQQMPHGGKVIRQVQYNTMDGNGNPQNIQTINAGNQNISLETHRANMQMRQQMQMQMRQQQINQQQMAQQQINQQQINQQQQMAQQQQMNTQQMNQQQMSQNQQIIMSNQPNQSPIHQQQPQSPLINHNATSPMPRSPMINYQHQNPNSPMMNVQGIDNSPRQIYMQQQQQQQQMMDHGNNNQNMMQGGGGMMNQDNPIPCAPELMKCRPIKLGLKGGTPMFGNGKDNKKQQASSEILQLIKKAQQQKQAQQQQQQQQQHTTITIDAQRNIPGKLIPTAISSAELQQASTSRQIQIKPKTSLLKNSLTPKVKSLVDYDDNDSSNGTPPISPLSQKVKQRLQEKSDDVVIVDSSPDEKQRLTDYDDDNDKIVSLTEVSLNSTAQDIGDADTEIVEAFDGSELVSSPLVTEQEATDYALFEQHVVHLDDSNESMKEIINTEMLFEEDRPKTSSSSKAQDTTDNVMYVLQTEKDKNPKSVGTREDFEAMIDSGKDEESETEKNEQSDLEVVEKPVEAAKSRIITATTSDIKEQIKIPVVRSSVSNPVSLTLPANIMGRTNISTNALSASANLAHNKLVKTATQTTAKVSIGNTTISVPVVLKKNMPISTSDSQQGTKKIITTSALTLSNLKKNPNLISISAQKLNAPTIVTLSLNKGNTRPIQTVDFKQRIHQKPGQQSIIVSAAPSGIITTQHSSEHQTITVTNIQNSVINKLAASCASPILTFSKIPTLTMTQDTALPTKILEDDDDKASGDRAKDAMKKNESSNSKSTDNNSNKVSEGTKDVNAENKPKSLIPVHLIIKSQESSQSHASSPIQVQAQRVASGNMSQLSPLSQPIEINTNTHNATQQIRSILSSIDSNEDSKNKTEGEQFNTATSTQSSIPKTIIRSTSTPTTLNQSSNDTKIIITQASTSIPSSQSGNVVFVKQIKALPSSATSTISTNSTIAIVSQSTPDQQGSSSVIISAKPSNLLSILSNQQQSSGTQQQTIKTSDGKVELPLTDNTKTVTIFKSNPTITNLLNSNSFKRSKSSDDVISTKETSDTIANKRLSFEVSNEIKKEPMDIPVIKESTTNTVTVPITNIVKTEPTVLPQSTTPQKILNQPPPQKSEDSNVLLKQLLQNSGSNAPGNPPQARNIPALLSAQRAPSLGVFSSLEAQLARPVIPPAPAKQVIVTTQPLVVSTVPTTISITSTPSISSISEPIKTSIQSTITKVMPIHETSFVSQPSQIVSNPPQVATSMSITTTTANEKKPIVILNRNDLPQSITVTSITTMPKTIISPATTTDNSGMAPPIMSHQNIIKKEMVSPGSSIKTSQSPTHTTAQPQLVKSISQSSLNSGTTTPVPMESPLVDIKKEMDDSSQSESISSDVSMVKTENILLTPSSRDGMNEPLDESPAKTAQEIANELKRKKRREYQKNRRQMQLSKEKGIKKPRKLHKSEEDYDSFIDNLMLQIKSLPQMQILEPLLPKNYGVCPIYGSNELNKINSLKKYNIASGELNGIYGKGELSFISDFYNTKPFGILEPKPEKAAASTQRGFYDQEFPPIKFDEEEKAHHRSKYDIIGKDRDVDTPDTVVGSSSPECVTIKNPNRFPGLRLIREEEDAEIEEEMTSFIDNRMSPPIPTIIAPVPIRLKTGISLTNENKSFTDKEFESSKQLGLKSCFEPPSSVRDNNNNNVTVTLTLTSNAAEDIMGVLKSLANILNIPAPTAYQIVERTTTPPSQKLGLYRIKGKDGKEGQPVDIQTILNGTAKFCRHCDVVILNNAIKAKANEFPLLVNTELESDEFYFCGQTCYKQFQWRPINMLDDKSLGPTLTDDKALESMSENISKVDMKGDSTPSIEHSNNLKRKHEEIEETPESKEEQLQEEKRQKLMRIKTFGSNCFQQVHKQKKLTEREITEMLFRMNITVNSAPKILEDTRKCIFCHQFGDGVADGPSRLLNYDVDKWVHLNCALWSDGVYETVNGALMNLEAALQQSLNSSCSLCNQLGATVKCFKARCGTLYHLNCAMKESCVFYKNKTTMCNIHAPKSEKDNELTTLSVQRRVYIDRDENRQVASIMHHSDLSNLMRVGSLILLNVGQLLPHQLQTFHSPNCIYPIGFKIIRFFWSMRHPNKRCNYVCSIADSAGRPEFRVIVKEPNEDDIELKDESPKKVWQKILESIAKLRRTNQLVQIFPKYVSGDDLFGLTEPAVVRILESLPGIETLNDYRFKYGRNPLLELPLAINPTGAARTEPRQKHALPWKKPHTQRTGSSSQRPAFVPSTSAGEVACPYSKQFVHSKSSQYKKMKLEWRNNVFLARSKIQGLGLYAARDLEKHTMVIEYIGEVIRGELSELREKQYEARNRGIYMFRLDEDRVIDATLSGGLARYINHSCNPNCVTEIVEVDREYRIIIFAKRRINRGEELSYDYKFDIEDESRKIACNCGAAYCKKYMN